jgi:cell wall-associated NlpC family hydrolase
MPKAAASRMGLALVAATTAVTTITMSAPVATAMPRAATVGAAAAPRPYHAWIDVAVAQIWVSPKSPRGIDRPMLSNPVRVSQWVRSMDYTQLFGLHGRVATQALLGDKVVVLRAKKDWREVRVPSQVGHYFPTGIVGWLPARQLTRTPLPVTKRVATVTSRRAVLHRKAARHGGGRQISYNTQLPYTGSTRHRVWVDVPGRRHPNWLPSRDVKVHRPTAPAISPTRRHVVKQAMQFRGLRFVWSGMSSFGFDCAGLVSTVYDEVGKHLPRDAADIARHGRPVAKHNLRPGDVVFFSLDKHRRDIHHAAMYIGHGLIVQSPHTGGYVSTAVLRTFDPTGYWGARRFLR